MLVILFSSTCGLLRSSKCSHIVKMPSWAACFPKAREQEYWGRMLAPLGPSRIPPTSAGPGLPNVPSSAFQGTAPTDLLQVNLSSQAQLTWLLHPFPNNLFEVWLYLSHGCSTEVIKTGPDAMSSKSVRLKLSIYLSHLFGKNWKWLVRAVNSSDTSFNFSILCCIDFREACICRTLGLLHFEHGELLTNISEGPCMVA